MKIVETYDILNPLLFETSEELRKAWSEVEKAIIVTDWPHGSGKFTIFPESGKKRGQGNGVKPIKIPCIDYLRKCGWDVEKLPQKIKASIIRPGDIDALKSTPEGFVAFEWETGNISSSHRALNKLFYIMQETDTLAGILVVPSDEMKKYLTDRVGNIGELRPYFQLWSNLTGIVGAVRVVAVEHDATSLDVPKIPKGTDGRAKF